MFANSSHKILTTIALLAALSGAANLAGTLNVRSLQDEVNERQKYIQDTVPLETLNRDIVQALAQLSVKNQDNDLRKLLETHGISFAVAPAKAP